MNNFQLLSLALNLIDVGFRTDAIRERLATEEASGVPESEVPALLERWRNEESARAHQVVDAASSEL